MRLASWATVCLGFLSACEPDSHLVHAGMNWMDWPAEVQSGVQFEVRLVVLDPCRWSRFQPGPSLNQSAVTFEPYFLGVRDDLACAGLLRIGNLDTTVMAPRLAQGSQTIEMRSTVWVSTVSGTQLSMRTFGDIAVRSTPDLSRRNAAGWVSSSSDTLGCWRIRPAGAHRAGSDIVLEDQADTVGLSGSFLLGYIHDAPAPVCGETRVFHLLSKN